MENDRRRAKDILFTLKFALGNGSILDVLDTLGQTDFNTESKLALIDTFSQALVEILQKKDSISDETLLLFIETLLQDD